MEDEPTAPLDGKGLANLRVVDLKLELEKRGLSKSGSKKDLVKRLKQQLDFEKLCEERKSTGDFEPKVKLDAAIEQNEFVQQYLAQQQKRMEEKRLAAEGDQRPGKEPPNEIVDQQVTVVDSSVPGTTDLSSRRASNKCNKIKLILRTKGDEKVGSDDTKTCRTFVAVSPDSEVGKTDVAQHGDSHKRITEKLSTPEPCYPEPSQTESIHKREEPKMPSDDNCGESEFSQRPKSPVNLFKPATEWKSDSKLAFPLKGRTEANVQSVEYFETYETSETVKHISCGFDIMEKSVTEADETAKHLEVKFDTQLSEETGEAYEISSKPSNSENVTSGTTKTVELSGKTVDLELRQESSLETVEKVQQSGNHQESASLTKSKFQPEAEQRMSYFDLRFKKEKEPFEPKVVRDTGKDAQKSAGFAERSETQCVLKSVKELELSKEPSDSVLRTEVSLESVKDIFTSEKHIESELKASTLEPVKKVFETANLHKQNQSNVKEVVQSEELEKVQQTILLDKESHLETVLQTKEAIQQSVGSKKENVSDQNAQFEESCISKSKAKTDSTIESRNISDSTGLPEEALKDDLNQNKDSKFCYNAHYFPVSEKDLELCESKVDYGISSSSHTCTDKELDSISTCYKTEETFECPHIPRDIPEKSYTLKDEYDAKISSESLTACVERAQVTGSNINEPVSDCADPTVKTDSGAEILSEDIPESSNEISTTMTEDIYDIPLSDRSERVEMSDTLSEEDHHVHSSKGDTQLIPFHDSAEGKVPVCVSEHQTEICKNIGGLNNELISSSSEEKSKPSDSQKKSTTLLEERKIEETASPMEATGKSFDTACGQDMSKMEPSVPYTLSDIQLPQSPGGGACTQESNSEEISSHITSKMKTRRRTVKPNGVEPEVPPSESRKNLNPGSEENEDMKNSSADDTDYLGQNIEKKSVIAKSKVTDNSEDASHSAELHQSDSHSDDEQRKPSESGSKKGSRRGGRHSKKADKDSKKKSTRSRSRRKSSDSDRKSNEVDSKRKHKKLKRTSRSSEESNESPLKRSKKSISPVREDSKSVESSSRKDMSESRVRISENSESEDENNSSFEKSEAKNQKEETIQIERSKVSNETEEISETPQSRNEQQENLSGSEDSKSSCSNHESSRPILRAGSESRQERKASESPSRHSSSSSRSDSSSYEKHKILPKSSSNDDKVHEDLNRTYSGEVVEESRNEQKPEEAPRRRIKLKRDRYPIEFDAKAEVSLKLTEKPNAESASDSAVPEQPTIAVEVDEPMLDAPYVSRKVSLSGRKKSQSCDDSEPKQKKSKWGSYAAKKAAEAVSISTDSLKSWFPDFKLISEPATPVEMETEEATLPEEKPKSQQHTGCLEIEAENDADSKAASTYTEVETESQEPILEDIPEEGSVSKMIFIKNLVRPFTLNQLKTLLKQSGNFIEESFWIDKIKSKCFVTYETEREALKAKNALHNTRWPASNPKILCVEFSNEEELELHKRGGEPPKPAPASAPEFSEVARVREEPKRERERGHRERERSKPQPPPIREWDRDKIVQDSPERESPDRRGPDKKDKKDSKKKASDDSSAKLLDDLFFKTKSTPCIYWLPLTEEQVQQKEEAKKQKQLEREKRLQQAKREEAERPGRRARSPRRSREKENRKSLTHSRSPASRRR